MTVDIRPLTLVAALVLLMMLAPFNARIAGSFRHVSESDRFFALNGSGPYAFFGGVKTEEEAEPAAVVLDGIALEAASAIVWDVEAGRALFEKNATEPRPLASLAKLATAIVGERILESVPAEARVVTVSSQAIREEGDDGFRAGEQFYFEDLRDAMLVRSSNDAAAAIAEWAESILPDSDSSYESVFASEMNRVASEIGLQSTYFLNATGLDIAGDLSGAYGTAEETARLVGWILQTMPEIMFATQQSFVDVTALSGEVHRLASSGAPALAIPGLIGAKTGYTDLAGGNLVAAWSAFGRPYVAVVLGSTREGRFSDMRALVERTVDFFAREPLH